MFPSSNRIPRWIVALLVATVIFAVPAYSQVKGEYSTWDFTIFGGAQYFELMRDHPAHSFADGPLFGLRFTQDFSKYIGIEESLGYGINNLRLKPFPPSPIGELGSGNRNYQIAIGPLFYFTPREAKVRPFITVGVGATWYVPTSEANDQFRSPAFLRYGVQDIDMRYGPSGIYGAGLKINASRRVGFRIDARGMLTQTPHFNLPSNPSGPGTLYIPRHGTENVLQLTAGITFRFGLRTDEPPPAPPAPPPPPPPPPPPEIQLQPIAGVMDVCAGESLTLGAPATVSTGVPLTYEWRLNNQPIGDNSPKVTIPTQGLTGSQTVTVRVSTGDVSQSSSATFNIKPRTAPTVTLSGLPATIRHGETLTINATATSPSSDCCGTATLAYTVSEGSITGTTFNSSTVAFDMSNRSRRQTRTIKVVATATDTCGQTGRAEGEITVTLEPEARRLDDLVFPANNSRVNNCAKRLLLEELTPLLRDEPTGRVILVGHRDERETGRAAATLDRARAMNSAAVISAGTGICPSLETSRISILTLGTDQSSTPRPALCGDSAQIRERRGQSIGARDPRAMFRRVEVWFVPDGAALPPALQNATPAPADELKKLGCPR